VPDPVFDNHFHHLSESIKNGSCHLLQREAHSHLTFCIWTTISSLFYHSAAVHFCLWRACIGSHLFMSLTSCFCPLQFHDVPHSVFIHLHSPNTNRQCLSSVHLLVLTYPWPPFSLMFSFLLYQLTVQGVSDFFNKHLSFCDLHIRSTHSGVAPLLREAIRTPLRKFY